MSYTQVETKTNTKSSIAIKPYADPEVENMGLQDYDMVVFEGVYHEEQLACLEVNGVKRYVTGLNEYAPDVKKINNEDQREARIREIRATVAQLERELAQNIIKEDDPEFWNKVTLLKPNNDEFWSKISIKVGNDATYLHLDKPHDLIKYHAIMAGGFSCIAPSLDHAKSSSRPPKFYLDRHEDTLSTKLSYSKLLDKATSKLVSLSDKNANKLLYIAKSLDNNSVSYTKNTPNDQIYKNMREYINAKGIETNKQKAAESFLRASEMTMEDLKLKAIVKDATFLQLIVFQSDGMIHKQDDGTILGRTPNEVVEYLRNPLNESIYEDLKAKTDVYFNK